MEKNTVQALRSLFFLAGDEEETLAHIAADPGCTEAEYTDGETIFAPDSFRRALVLLTEGGAEVYNESGGRRVLLNTLKEGEVFGAAGLFGAADSYVTHVEAKGKTSALLLSDALVTRLLGESPTRALRYIAFLSDRVRFLNRRIDAFTAGSAEAKVAASLFSADLSVPVSLVRMADQLGIGRASLYRALDSLEERGLICRDGKRISLPDRTALAVFIGKPTEQ